MTNPRNKSWIERVGCEVSSRVADLSAHPFAQIGIIVFCGLWWLIGLPTDILTAALSILAITLTQMVLNNQSEREADDHRRDVAMHAKLDELVIASRRARNEVAGIEEELEEEDIEELRHHALEAIEAASDETADDEDRAKARHRIAAARVELKKAT